MENNLLGFFRDVLEEDIIIKIMEMKGNGLSDIEILTELIMLYEEDRS